MSNIVLATSRVVIVEVGFTYTEEKAKDRVYSILAALATVFCTRTIMKNRMNSSFSSKQPEAIHPNLQIVLCKTDRARRN